MPPLYKKTASIFRVLSIAILMSIPHLQIHAQDTGDLSVRRVIDMLRAGVTVPRLLVIIGDSRCIKQEPTQAERDELTRFGASGALMNSLERIPPCSRPARPDSI
jgi:hypothetical protein